MSDPLRQFKDAVMQQAYESITLDRAVETHEALRDLNSLLYALEAANCPTDEVEAAIRMLEAIENVEEAAIKFFERAGCSNE